MTFLLIPGSGAKVSSGIKSKAFAAEPGIKNSNTNTIRYSIMIET